MKQKCSERQQEGDGSSHLQPDRKRRVATVLGQIINLVITQKIQQHSASYPLNEPRFVMQHSVFTNVNHQPLQYHVSI